MNSKLLDRHSYNSKQEGVEGSSGRRLGSARQRLYSGGREEGDVESQWKEIRRGGESAYFFFFLSASSAGFTVISK